jgi:hypothetical protein
MNEITRVRGFPITVKQEEIVRVLGYRAGGIPERVAALLSEIEPPALGMIETACAYRLFDAGDLLASPYLRGIESAALCLVTIGGALEAAVETDKQRGDLSRALILDTYGSAAAEACADAAENFIREEAAAKGVRCSLRFSPGYSGWDVAEQRWILPALEGETLGVTLTEGCMMVPRKSITFAVTIGENPVEMRHATSCEVCGLLNCRYRHTGDDYDKGAP